MRLLWTGRRQEHEDRHGRGYGHGHGHGHGLRSRREKRFVREKKKFEISESEI
jgi:hypothetical protein